MGVLDLPPAPLHDNRALAPLLQAARDELWAEFSDLEDAWRFEVQGRGVQRGEGGLRCGAGASWVAQELQRGAGGSRCCAGAGAYLGAVALGSLRCIAAPPRAPARGVQGGAGGRCVMVTCLGGTGGGEE